MPIILGIIELLWLTHLAINPVFLWDETEHCHVAWLVGHEQLTVLHDFFQHHQPLLWTLLGWFYRAGGEGPEVFFFGRALLVFCFGATLMALHKLNAAQISTTSSHRIWSRGLCLFALIVWHLCCPSLFVIRPEMLCYPAFTWAMVLWLKQSRRRIVCDVIAGALLGAAIYSSPRFILVAPIFLIWSAPIQLDIKRAISRLASASSGVLGFVLIYHALTGYPLSLILFNTAFSAKLQTIGDGGAWVEGLYYAVGFSLAVIIFFFFLLPRASRQRWAILTAGFVGAMLISELLGAKYSYTQNFAVLPAWLTVMICWGAPRIDWTLRSRIAAQTVVFATVVALFFAGANVPVGNAIFEYVKSRREIMSSLQPQDRVLITAEMHPIAARDASFYGVPLVDANNRLCRAVELFRQDWQLPPCDYFRDIREERPKLVHDRLLKVVPPAEEAPLQTLLNRDYLLNSKLGLYGRIE